MNFTSAKYICNPEKPDVNAVVKAEIESEGTVYIPVGVEGNRHWVAIQKWVAEGNTIAEAD